MPKFRDESRQELVPTGYAIVSLLIEKVGGVRVCCGRGRDCSRGVARCGGWHVNYCVSGDYGDVDAIASFDGRAVLPVSRHEVGVSLKFTGRNHVGLF